MNHVINVPALLGLTSRTFGLSIPLLPEPHRHQMSLAYLLFRVADTLEDADGKPRSERLAALAQLREVLRAPNMSVAEQAATEWCKWRPSQHTGYMQLLEAFPGLLATVLELDRTPRSIIMEHTQRTVDGMASFVSQSADDGSLRLQSLGSLHEYCYSVAGIVGEMITELFVTGNRDLANLRATLMQHAVAFGEGLQLVNILKDARQDAHAGRCYLPADIPLSQVFEIARDDLFQADQWIAALKTAHADPGMIAFGRLPVELARATLDLVEQTGPGTKLPRSQVARIVNTVDPDFKLLGRAPIGIAEHCPT